MADEEGRTAVGECDEDKLSKVSGIFEIDLRDSLSGRLKNVGEGPGHRLGGAYDVDEGTTGQIEEGARRSLAHHCNKSS